MTTSHLYYKAAGSSAAHVVTETSAVTFRDGIDVAKRMIANSREKPGNNDLVVLSVDEGDDHPTVWVFKYAVPAAPEPTLLAEYDF